MLLDSRVGLDGKQPALSNSSGTPSLYWLRHQEESWPWKGRRREQDEREDVENWVNPLNLEVWCLLIEKPRVIDPRWWEDFYCFPISTIGRLWDWLFCGGTTLYHLALFVLYCILECFPSSMRGHLCDWNGIKLIAFKLITWVRLFRPLFRLLIFIIIDKQLIGGLADYLKTYYWGPSSSIYSSPLLSLHYLWWTIESRWSFLLQLNLISIICVLDECWREIPSLL